MPRPSGMSSLDRTLNEIISRAAGQIAQAVRENIAAEVTRLVTQSAGARQTAGRVARLADGAAPQRKRRVIRCPVEGCGKAGGGPKWGWFCAAHKDLPAAEKDKAREAVRGKGAQGSKRKRKK